MLSKPTEHAPGGHPTVPRRANKAWPPPVLALGFRPFYLLAAIYGAVSVPLWTAQLTGGFAKAVVINGPQWHGHEMLFGYALAVIVGFLFTAVRNWTQRSTPSGSALATLAVLWLAGRILALTPWSAWTAASDTAFILGAAIGIARPLVASGNRRNYFFVALVLALAVANLAFHGALQGVTPFTASRALTIGLDVVLLIMAVVAGRVVPLFINNSIPGAGARRIPTIERAALTTVVLLLAADLADEAAIAAVVAAAAAVVHGARLALWAPLRTRRNALLWILPVSYSWIIVHLALRSGAPLGWYAPSLALHALTVGAIGGMTLGMMTRSALGHTARPLAAGPAEIACFSLIQLAAATRVVVPLLSPDLYVMSTIAATVPWTCAFSIFAVAYWPILTRPRLDLRPG